MTALAFQQRPTGGLDIRDPMLANWLNAVGRRLGVDAVYKAFSFTRDLSAASASVAYTGITFRPRSAVFAACIDATEFWSIGFDDGVTALSVSHDSAPDTLFSATSSIALVGVGPVGGIANVSSWDLDGFTLAWTKQGAAAGTASIAALLFL